MALNRADTDVVERLNQRHWTEQTPMWWSGWMWWSSWTNGTEQSRHRCGGAIEPTALNRADTDVVERLNQWHWTEQTPTWGSGWTSGICANDNNNKCNWKLDMQIVIDVVNEAEHNNDNVISLCNKTSITFMIVSCCRPKTQLYDGSLLLPVCGFATFCRLRYVEWIIVHVLKAYLWNWGCGHQWLVFKCCVWILLLTYWVLCRLSSCAVWVQHSRLCCSSCVSHLAWDTVNM